MQTVRNMYKMVRWRLLPVRYAGKAGSYLRPHAARRHRLRAIDPIMTDGFAPGPSIPREQLEAIQALAAARVADVRPTKGGHPFVNLIRPEDFTADSPILQFAFSPAVLDRADDYFNGALIFDSIQLLYSWPTEGPLAESQMWHRDYGDFKSLHCVAYINDVLSDDDGPFVFIDRNDTRRIGAYPIIRRIPDHKFERELGDGTKRSFYGHAGESVLIDPAVCYHYGSRCKNGRLAIFVTFNTDRPMTQPIPAMRENRTALLAAATRIRPDLSPDYLSRLLGG